MHFSTRMSNHPAQTFRQRRCLSREGSGNTRPDPPRGLQIIHELERQQDPVVIIGHQVRDPHDMDYDPTRWP